jgi:formate dehydrogenase maturation protein FdhE
MTYNDFPYMNMTEEQWEAYREQMSNQPPPVERTAFDLEKQTDDEFAEFLKEVEEKANADIDRELERAAKKEAEAEARVAALKESVGDE